ncbi:MAG: hypothetical protein A2Y79_03390 [Deltaproteobacteria bacterium RBG_13_43_22]|jgi:hypothetical protein|nr:MAG: hypothetical protein A2Y79_03390 [Deltaproteobacteria bacterium RBG_13_43_22]
MNCQLQASHGSPEPISVADRFGFWWRKRQHYLLDTARKIITDPLIVRRKLETKLGGKNPAAAVCASEEGSKTVPLLGLKGGERVRVKSLEEINDTLNAEGRCGGLGFMTVEMKKYCGGIYTVRKRIHWFFDERRWRMLKVKDTVILDEVFCELPANIEEDWAGCDRTCFLFWHEAWLERLPVQEGNRGAATKGN